MGKKLANALLFFMTLMVLSCQEKDLNFKVRFENVDGLKAGDGVFFENNAVGRVTDVVYTDRGDYLVALTVMHGFRDAATEHSEFYVVKNPEIRGSRSVGIVQEEKGGQVLHNGAIVKGSVKQTLFEKWFGSLWKQSGEAHGNFEDGLKELKKHLREMSESMGAGLENVLNDLSEQLKRLEDQTQKIPESGAVKELEETLKRLGEELSNSGEAVRDKIHNELIPELQKELDRLRKNLERHNRQKEADPLDRRIEEILKT